MKRDTSVKVCNDMFGKETKLLHYGLQRSGTNFLETHLKRKYRVRFLNSNDDRRSPVQKHFRLYDEKDIVPEPQYHNELETADLRAFEQLLEIIPDYYLIISKDPYSWLLSYNAWAEKCNWPDVSHHYILEYNLFYKKWLDFSLESEKILFVRYLDMLADIDEEIGRLESVMSLDRRLLYPLIPSFVNKVPESTKFSNDRRAYYLHDEYLESYSNKDLHRINNLIDPDVLAGLGYQKKGFL